MQVHAGMNVFGDGLGLKPTDLLQRLSTEQAPAACEEGAVVRITAGLQRTEEQGLFVLDEISDTQISLKNVGIIEVVGSLNDGHFGIIEESNGLFQERPGRD